MAQDRLVELIDAQIVSGAHLMKMSVHAIENIFLQYEITS